MLTIGTTSRSGIRNVIRRFPTSLRLVSLMMTLLFTVAAQAQFESASVLGYVRDQSGAAVANANVTLTNTATGISHAATSDPEGRYEFSSIPIGPYVLKAQAASFAPTQSPSFALTTDARQRVD